jgi:DNA-directed RNA polymerase subunit H (RpoH/RPB5)
MCTRSRIAGVSSVYAYARVSILIRILVGDAAKFLDQSSGGHQSLPNIRVSSAQNAQHNSAQIGQVRRVVRRSAPLDC